LQVPHCPPQPSSPHALPAHAGTQTVTSGAHLPPWQVSPPSHTPHTPPQPSGPQLVALQLGTQGDPSGTQKLPEQICPAPQVPHAPPQPSGPHFASLQMGLHTGVSRMQEPLEQTKPAAQMPHSLPQPSSPHWAPSQEGVHTAAPQASGFATMVPPLARPAAAVDAGAVAADKHGGALGTAHWQDPSPGEASQPANRATAAREMTASRWRIGAPAKTGRVGGRVPARAPQYGGSRC
jgi:hypothetical protein